MASLTRDQVVQVVGNLEDDRIVEILATGANLEQLTEAFAWLTEDEYLGKQLRHPPAGVVAQLVDILEADEPGWDER
jgi:hypothetical protein